MEVFEGLPLYNKKLAEKGLKLLSIKILKCEDLRIVCGTQLTQEVIHLSSGRASTPAFGSSSGSI